MYKTIHKEGATLIGELPDGPHGRATVHVILVPELQRHRGIGTKMLQEFETAARSARAKQIDTIFSNESTDKTTRPGLIALFTKNGFSFNHDLGLGPLYSKQLEKRHRHKKTTK